LASLPTITDAGRSRGARRLGVAYLAEAIGRWSSAYDLSAWLAVSGPAFWKGRVWSVVTFVLLPAGLLDFLFNGMMIACLGPLIERPGPGASYGPTF